MIEFTDNKELKSIYIKASGHVTAQYCSEVKNFCFSELNEDSSVNHVYLDMENCDYMDSTFIGVIAGINKRLKKISGESIQIQNIGKTCLSLLKTMGLLPLITILEKPITFPIMKQSCSVQEKITAGDILEVHEELMDISDDNKKRFSTLHQILSDEVEESLDECKWL
jgi:anti-anti-sigma factor